MTDPRLGRELHSYENRTPPLGFEPHDFDSQWSYLGSVFRNLGLVRSDQTEVRSYRPEVRSRSVLMFGIGV